MYFTNYVISVVIMYVDSIKAHRALGLDSIKARFELNLIKVRVNLKLIQISIVLNPSLAKFGSTWFG